MLSREEDSFFFDWAGQEKEANTMENTKMTKGMITGWEIIAEEKKRLHQGKCVKVISKSLSEP